MNAITSASNYLATASQRFKLRATQRASRPDVRSYGRTESRLARDDPNLSPPVDRATVVARQLKAEAARRGEAPASGRPTDSGRNVFARTSIVNMVSRNWRDGIGCPSGDGSRSSSRELIRPAQVRSLRNLGYPLTPKDNRIESLAPRCVVDLVSLGRILDCAIVGPDRPRGLSHFGKRGHVTSLRAARGGL